MFRSLAIPALDGNVTIVTNYFSPNKWVSLPKLGKVNFWNAIFRELVGESEFRLPPRTVIGYHQDI